MAERGFCTNLKARYRQYIFVFTLKSHPSNIIFYFLGENWYWGKNSRTIFCQGFVLLLCGELIAIHAVSLAVWHVAVSAIWRDSVCDVQNLEKGLSSSWCFRKHKLERICEPIEDERSPNEDTNLTADLHRIYSTRPVAISLIITFNPNLSVYNWLLFLWR